MSDGRQGADAPRSHRLPTCSHAPRRNAEPDAPQPYVLPAVARAPTTQRVEDGVPTERGNEIKPLTAFSL
jgi:hypothetical protein